MKGKLLGFGVALLAVATIGVVQLQTAAKDPGQVGDAPRCTVNVAGQRSKAFTIADNGKKATVDFTVKGKKNCKVQVSTAAFYAPSIDGRPYEKQILHDRNTRVLTPGKHTMRVSVPATSTKKKGCFYQLDLTYGVRNVMPILAYAHGKIDDCGKKKRVVRSASCDSLTVTPLSNTSFRFDVAASAKNASIKGYVFTITKNGQTVDTKRINTTNKKQSLTYDQLIPGTYSVAATVKTSIDDKAGANCKGTFTVPTPPIDKKPGISVDKFVKDANGQDQKFTQVEVGAEFQYRIGVTNTGDTDLTQVVITDTPAAGVTLLQPSSEISDNTWAHTIPSLKVGETQYFTLTASVPAFLSGRITNTVCVNAPEVPGDRDDCDSADVEAKKQPVEKPEKVIVCDPETGEIISVDKDDADKYLHKDSTDCKDSPIPETLPETGPVETAMQMTGAASLFGASAYYLTSRRHW
jgi:uncharacterized repeat protein (TIGR01451 family)